MHNQIFYILNDMSEVLDLTQMKRLQEVLLKRMDDSNVEVTSISNYEYLDMFLAAKTIEGCSDRTIAYYKSTIEHMITTVDTPIRKITTDILRDFLAKYQERNNCGKATIDNIRRNLSSFYSWLEVEDHIIKSPIRRIKKIKSGDTVKETISDECIEIMRDGCAKMRDLAMIDLLYSTGMKVGELVNLNIEDIKLEDREVIVHGEDDKERRVYL